MSIEKRLEALERRFSTDPIVLTMADGTERIISAGDVMGFMRRALQDPSGEDAMLIKTSVSAKEPGGARLVELARAILMSPTEEQ